MRVVFLVLDAMPHRVLSRDLTPNLWSQVEAGGRAPQGGLSLPVSVTYSNHAAFVTGLDASETGLWGNSAWNGDHFIKTWDAGPRGKTLFDRFAAARKTTMSAIGDHKLGVTMGTQAADVFWPPSAEVPAGTKTDEYGYPADDAVVEAAARMDLRSADFVLLHLNEPDTTMHVHGPESPEAFAQYRASDVAYGQMLELLGPGWEDTVMITVSDHEQEEITHPECVNLKGALNDRFPDAVVRHDGTGAIVMGDVSIADLRSVDGVEGAFEPAPGVRIAWTDPGRMFGVGQPMTKGNHGSPRCRTQVAIISGGHPKAQELARQVEVDRPGTLTWAPLIASLL